MYFLIIKKGQLCHTIIQGVASLFILGITIAQKLGFLLRLAEKPKIADFSKFTHSKINYLHFPPKLVLGFSTVSLCMWGFLNPKTYGLKIIFAFSHLSLRVWNLARYVQFLDADAAL